MRRAFAGGCCALALLTACSDAGSPATLPTLTASAPAIPSPVSVPDVARLATPEGARAFVRHWFAVLNASFSSRDASRLRALSTESCESCDNYAGVVEALAVDGQTVEGGELNLEFVEVPPIEGSMVVLDAAFTRTASTRRGPDGRVIATAPPAPRTVVQIKLVRVDASWLFDAMRLVSP